MISMDEVRQRGAEVLEALAELRDTFFGFLLSRRLQSIALSTIAYSTCTIVLGLLSIPIYGALYHFNLPDQIIEVPLYLQYGYGANPFAVASLDKARIKNLQAYDVEISLTIPQSPENVAYGNFMVGLMLLGESKQNAAPRDAPPPRYDSKGSPFNSIVQPVDIGTYAAEREVLHVSTRPTRVPYRSPLASKAAALLRLPYYAVWPGSETTTIAVRMADRVTFGRGLPVPKSVLVEIQAGQSLQVYEAAGILTAQLHGVRYFMYHYRLTAAVTLMSFFWMAAILSFSFFFTVPFWWLVPKEVKVKAKSNKGDSESEDNGKMLAIKKEEGLSDTERTFPSLSKQPLLKYEPPIKQEKTEPDIPPLNPGALADDEDDEEDRRARDSGIGTSFSDNVSREGARRRSSKGHS
ncbi:putative adipose-regulatory protein-domain-containing protein [Podospora aff. communis PSN243]|uniref:Adipose-regulatory protein-domain-containing protein n=1 Tax=Podospora aff. communis PSN243 TaxID=3040156 RepID=A0AAV9H3N3_9PEZI|nr:putative adipose-regulatory protein-domain-containing protein [Podospora aff. communis PSN243]